MTYSIFTSRLRGRLFCSFSEKGSVLADFKEWRKSATPFFADWRTSLIYYTAILRYNDIMISKGSEYEPKYSAFKKERNTYEIQKT